MATEIASLFARVGADITGLQSGLANAKNSLIGAGSMMTSTGAMMTAGITLPLLAAGGAAAKFATDFDAQMRNIQSISKQSDESLGVLSDRFITMSTDLTKTRDSAENLAKGFYQIQSSGFAGEDAMTILEVSTKAASAGLTDTETAAKAILSVLNAYGLEASEAAHVSDVLFKSVDVGVFSFGEISGAIGDTLGAAAAAKIPIEDLGAAFATMTKAGINVNESATSINQLMLSFIKPTDSAKDAAQAMGVELSLNALQTKGLGGVIKDLATHTQMLTVVTGGASDELKGNLSAVESSMEALKRWKLEQQAAGTWTKEAKQQFEQQSAALKIQKMDVEGMIDASADYATTMQVMSDKTGLTVDQLAELFPNVRALRAALSLARDGGEDFAKDLETIKDAAGATTAAFEIQNKSWAAQWDNFKNKGVAALIGFGQVIVPALMPLMDGLGKVLDMLRTADPQWIRTALGVLAIVAAIGPVLTVIGFLTTALGFLLSPIGLVVAGVALLALAIATNFGGIRDWLVSLAPMFTPLVTAFMGFVAALQASAPQVQALGAVMFSALQSALATVGPQVTANLQNMILAISSFVTQAGVWWTQHGAQVLAVLSTLWQLAVVIVGMGITLLTGLITAGLQLLNGNWVGALNTLGASLEAFFNLALSLVGSNMTEFREVWGNNLKMVAIILMTTFNNAIANLQGMISQFMTIGGAIVNGIISGITGGIGALISAAVGAATAAYNAMRSALQARSPSKLFEKLGQTVPQGLAQGIGAGADMPANAVRSMVPAMTGGVGGGGVSVSIGSIVQQPGQSAEDLVTLLINRIKVELAAETRLMSAGGGQYIGAG